MRNVLGNIGGVFLVLGSSMLILLKVFVPKIPLYVLIMVIVLFLSAVILRSGYYLKK